MKHVMLDLETMGTGPRAAIVAIGAVEFDPRGSGIPEGFGVTFYRGVTLESSVAAGLEMDTSTILWWMQQSDDARRQTFTKDGAVGLPHAIGAFHDFLRSFADHEIAIWGNGATFDNVVLRSAYKAVGITPSWSFRNDKCYRTVCNLLPADRQPALVRHGTFHNALDDAITQALHLQKVYALLGL